MSEQTNGNNGIIETKIKELENVKRLCANTISLISDSEFKGAYSGPVAECLSWLDGFQKTVQVQIEGFKATLPKPETIEAPKEEAKVEA